MDRNSSSLSSPGPSSDADEPSLSHRLSKLGQRRCSSQESRVSKRAFPIGGSRSSTAGFPGCSHGPSVATTDSSSLNGEGHSIKTGPVPCSKVSVEDMNTPVVKGLSKRRLWPSGIRWSKNEIVFYISMAIGLHCYSLYRSGEVSQNANLSLNGVIPSSVFPFLLVDDSDHQWHVIRIFLPLILLLGVAHIAGGYFVGVYFSGRGASYLTVGTAELPWRASRAGGYRGEEEEAAEIGRSLYNVHGLATAASNSSRQIVQSDSKQMEEPVLSSQPPEIDSHSEALPQYFDYFSQRTSSRCLYECLFGLCFVFGLHQFGAFFLLFIVIANYFVVSFCLAPSRYHSWDRAKSQRILPAFTWIYCVGFLFANDMFNGYQFGAISKHLVWMDGYRGLYSWTDPFNFVILKMISYNFDYAWAVNGTSAMPPRLRASPKTGTGREEIGTSHAEGGTLNHSEGHLRDSGRCSVCHAFGTCLSKTNLPSEHRSPRHYLCRSGNHCPLEAYGLTEYLAYLLFAPLYLAGPICSFNAWISQIAKPQSVFSWREICLYGLNCMKFLLLNLMFTHGIFSTAILTKNQHLWGGYSLLTLWFLSMSSLLHIWLKLTFIWRLFRFWALAAGIDTPENMLRCLFNNMSIASFWKSWHSSFNQWLLRYLYFPLGGGHVPIYRKALNIILVFTFVAVWHDINLKLLSWSWLICLGFIPEIVATTYFSKPKFDGLKSRPLWRFMIACAISVQNFTLAVANLVGFAFGLAGAQEILATKSGGEIVGAVLFGLFFMYVPANVTLWRDSKIDGVVGFEEAPSTNRTAVELSDSRAGEQGA